MADGTKIEWTDATVNAVNGCSVISPGCKHCYAMKQAHRFPVRQGLTQKTAGGMVWTGEVRLNEAALLQPLAWKRPRKIFWNAHGDLFHENVPDEWIDRVFAVCALTPHHTHQILTKRSARMREWMVKLEAAFVAWFTRCDPDLLHDIPHMAAAIAHPAGPRAWPLPNVWLGVSVEDQLRADARIPDLLATPAAVRFLSCEPLLGPVDLTRVRRFAPGVADKEWVNAIAGRMWTDQSGLPNPDPRWAYPGIPFSDGGRGIDWVIVGGESGPGARPMHPDWARGLRDQCAAAGVPFFFKQWGEWNAAPEIIDAAGQSFHRFDDGTWMQRRGKKAAGRLLDGVQHDGMPS